MHADWIGFGFCNTTVAGYVDEGIGFVEDKQTTPHTSMVKEGQFTVELVDAFTKVPFLEHTAPDGRTYVEVEPDQEHFIRVQAEDGVDGIVRLKAKVDGESLGYSTNKIDGGWITDLGLWSMTAEKSTETALKFGKILVRGPSDVSESGNVPVFWTGQVQVYVYEGIFKAIVNKKNFSSRFEGGDVSYAARQSKGVKSEVGSATDVSKRSTRKKRKSYKCGKTLHSVKLNYCSVVGLIHAGILPKPPLWEDARTRMPAKRSESCGRKSVTVQPKKIRLENLVPPKEIDFFYLSRNSVTVQPRKIRLEDRNSLLPPKEIDLFDLTKKLDGCEDDT